MRIVVTGASGFIGAALCRALVARGETVVALHRPSSNLRLLEGLPVEHALGDLTQPESLRAALAGAQAVFHTAALLGGRPQPGRQYTITVEGSRNLLQAARLAGVGRVVHTSSVAALGVSQAGAVLDENHTWNLRPDYWPYGYAKYLAELEVQRAVAQGLDAVIVNPSLVFGPGDVYRQNSSPIVQMARGRIPFLSEGGLNVVHLEDVIEGHLAALERGQTGRRYILGGENLAYAELLACMGKVVGAKPPEMVLPAGLLRGLAGPLSGLQALLPLPVSADLLRLAGYTFFYSSRRARTELGVPLARPAEAAITAAADWFRATGAL